MGEVFAAFRDDRALRVAVLRTAGERFFSAGWDLKAAAAGDAVDGDYGVGGFGGIQELPALNKPVIALVEGMAVGGGFELALSCDLIYAADTASFALPEINAGTLADAATLRLPTRMPHHIAMELLLTGRWMDAAEAHRWGLVNEVHPPDRLAERGLEVAARLAEGPPLVFAAMRDKDVGGMFLSQLPAVGALIVTRASNPRTTNPEELAHRARIVAPDTPVDASDIAPTAPAIRSTAASSTGRPSTSSSTSRAGAWARAR
jgi:enoyl-CoA hydratase/carnithine racemase